ISRRPPCPPLFPYTTLFRSERREEIRAAMIALAELEWVFARGHFAQEFRCSIPRFSDDATPRLKLRWARHPLLEDVLKRQGIKRSEEHTSELQSRENLVCRL